jgi:sialidase-1
LITSNQGTLLAFAEGRQTLSDHAQNDIVLKRSVDGGKSWGKLIIVHEDGANVLVNPTSVVLPSGRVLLMYQHFPAGYHARAITSQQVKLLQPGVSGFPISKTLITHSDDDGLTWSTPRDVTAGTKRPEAIISTASGPGIGIILSQGNYNGRIIIPTNEGWWEENKRFFNVFACYSDDGGETWNYGQPAPNGDKGFGNEVQMAELSNGSILLNSRSFQGNKNRKLAISDDGGQSWSPLKDHEQLPEPQCMGSMLRFSWPEDGQNCILYSGPGGQNARKEGTLRWSFDEGKTWPHKRLVYPGGFAYSCLTKMKDGSVGLLFEADGYKRIVFTKLTLL